MQPPIQISHLSRISTQWTKLQQAHDADDTGQLAARQQVLERYGGAAYRYLLAMLRDEDAAMDAFQEFALRFVEGRFENATPQRGRFRDYLKKSLVHLTRDYQRQQQRSPKRLHSDIQPSASEPAEQDSCFLAGWRSQLLDQTWDYCAREHSTLCSVLQLHIQNPTSSAAEKAKLATQLLGRRFDANRFRVTLHRARKKFAERLIHEVAQSMDQRLLYEPQGPPPCEVPTAETASAQELITELRTLRLYHLCKGELERVLKTS